MIIKHITESDGWHVDEDVTLPFTIYKSNNATLEDITGWTLSFIVKDVPGGSAVLTKTTSSGIALTTPASGLATVTVADTDTVSITPGKYQYELKRTNAGFEKVLAKGTVELLPSLHV